MTSSLLSDLCSICSNNLPKYQCPRCTCRTCSLPCYKRHQKWSQCSGKRDPAAYASRRSLATASGIDHDFNFLTGVERAVANADRNADNRGIDLEHGLIPRQKSSNNLQHALDNSTVKIHRAPKGMSRQKANNTRLSLEKQLIWTIEWLHLDGTKSQGECLEDASLDTAYHNNFQPRAKKRKLKHLHGRKEAPSTRLPQPSPAIKAEPLKQERTETPCDTATIDETLRTSTISKAEVHSLVKKEPSRQLEPVRAEPHSSLESTTSGSPEEGKFEGDDKIVQQASVIIPEQEIKTEDADLQQPPGGQSRLHYYLLKPFVRAGERVLIQTDPKASLSSILRNHEVFEFPTFQVLREPPEALPNRFTLEATYLKKSNKLIQEVDSDNKRFAR